MITQALVVDEPWIGKILSGDKTWEMRSRRTNKVGMIGLIKKGSGTIVGTARLTGSLPPIDKKEWMKHFSKHQVPMSLLERDSFNWFVPWVLTDVKRLAQPVRYSHPSGAVQFVNLSIAEVAELNGRDQPSPPFCQKYAKSNMDERPTISDDEWSIFPLVASNGSSMKDWISIISSLVLVFSAFGWIIYSAYAIATWSGSFSVFVILASLIIISSAALQATIGGISPQRIG